jgi:hypothetical protein
MKPVSLLIKFMMLCAVFSTTLQNLQAKEPQSPTSFEKDIRPILREFCFDCHGATSEPDGSLDLRLVKFMLKGGDSGAVIEPGDPEASYLLGRMKSGEMPPGEAQVPAERIATLERWITEGAKTLRPEPETIGPGIPITLEERNYWAFQPIKRPEVPTVKQDDRSRTPVDRFLRQAMPEGLSFSSDADRLTLIKRVYFDLTGLPPAPDELSRWQNHTSDDWYEQLVNSILDSPHYGERWARHWLDVAGYADSEGNTLRDDERPWAWKYRDYVIRSLNEDKPFDQFITEQIAGDELAGPIAGDLTAEQIELLTATGFLRMAADGTGSGDNSPEARNKVMADTIKIVSSSLLGMSVACAQCHDHRYDPISQIDYFALRSVFEPAYDWQQWKIPTQRRISLYTASDREKAAEVEAEVKKIAAEKSVKQTEYMAQALAKELEKYEEPLRAELRLAYETPVKERNADQKALLKKHPSVNITPGVLYQYLPEAAKELKTFDQKIAELRKQKKPEEFLRVLNEKPGHVPVTKLFHRGDHKQPKQEVAPAGLTIAAPEGAGPSIPLNNDQLPTTGRRLAYAEWLTSGKHPLVARVLVNRVWMHHFGRGLVSTPSDFGKLGDVPTNPELLDWLADEFMREGWSLKHLHRLILTSTAWRQTSMRDPEMNKIDPENKCYWRKPMQRLEAEILRDRMISASGTLKRELFGIPVAIKEDETGQVIVDGPQTRRSLYIKVRRSQPVAMLQTFDAPVMDVNCERRPVSTVATQSLMLMNGEFTLDQAAKLAGRAVDKPHPLDAELQKSLPQLPSPPPAIWAYGYGRFNEQTKLTEFTPLPHWTGSDWQGGSKRPDPTIGWVIVNKSGGHPGREYSAIRRWIAPAAGTLTISGTLSHGSENGDGVRGRIVSSRSALAGEWQAHNGKAATKVPQLDVQPGDTIDLITDCLAHETSDSFSWPVTITLKTSAGESLAFSATDDFHGPQTRESYAELPKQVASAWELAYLRPPTTQELQVAMQFVANQLNELHQDDRGTPSGVTAGRQVLINLCQVLLNSNEFIYID